MTEYTPIDCNKYDFLEVAALIHMKVNISYIEDNTIHHISDYITTIRSINKEEFIFLKSGISIRLDKLIKVGDNVFNEEQFDTSCINDTTLNKI